MRLPEVPFLRHRRGGSDETAAGSRPRREGAAHGDVRAYTRSLQEATRAGRAGQWLPAARAAARALAEFPDDPYARDLLASIAVEIQVTDAATAARIQRILGDGDGVAERSPLLVLAHALKRPARRAGRRRAHAPRVLRAYANALLSTLLVLVVLGGNTVQGTWAYFSASLPVTTNTFTTGSLSAPTGLSTSVSGTTITVSWTAAANADGYDVYVDTPGTPVSYSLAGSTSSTSYAYSATAGDGTYSFVVRTKKGSFWSSADSSVVTASVTASPSVSSTNPSSGSTGVPLDTTIAITFSKAMNTASVQAAFSASPSITCAWTWSSGDTVGTCTPSANLAADTFYTLTISTAAQDSTGTAMSSAYSWSFRTNVTSGAPSVTGVSPYGGSTTAGPNTSVAVTFSQTMDQASAQNAFSLQQTSGTGSPCYVTGGTPLCGSNGGSFSWSGNTLTFDPSADLQASTPYAVGVAATATNTGGTALSSAFSSTFTTAAAADTTPPYAIPPTTPDNGATGVGVNTRVNVTFSEAMAQTVTQNAFSLRQTSGTGSPCYVTGGTPLCGSNGGTFTWGGTANNILSFEPYSSLVASTSYTATITSGATDLVGLALYNAPFTFSFTTGTGTVANPNPPTVTSPLTEEWTNNSTYTITGSADANALVEIWSDADNNGSIDGTDTLVASLQLEGGLTSWSISVNLTTGAANNFLATIRNSVGVRSSATDVPTINQGDPNTTVGSLSLSPGSNNLSVFAFFEGDANNTIRSATAPGGTVGCILLEWKASSSSTWTTVPCSSISRGGSYFTAEITGLATGTSYDVRSTFYETAPDTVSGTNPQTASATTAGSGTATGFISSIPPTAAFASRAPQSTLLSANLGTDPDSGLFIISLPSPYSSVTSPCLAKTSGAVRWEWNGKDGAGAWVPDGSYTFAVRASNGPSCSVGGGSQQSGGNLVTISNAASVQMSPPPATTFLYAGQSTTITATVRNARDELLPDGTTTGTRADVTWTATGSVTGNMTSALSRTTSEVGVSYTGECTVSSNAGQACVKLTIPTGSKATQTITITASVASQSGTTPTIVRGSTTVMDPPLPPSDPELSIGSVRVRWQPTMDPGIAGYRVYIGTQSGVYTHVQDVGLSTDYRYEDVVPGTRYYVQVRSYSKDGLLSPPTNEKSLLIPLPTATPTSSPTATLSSTPTPQPTASPTPVPTATPTLTPTPTATSTSTASPTPVSSSTPAATGTPTVAATGTPAPSVSPTTPTTTPSAVATGVVTPSPGPTTGASATPTVTTTATAQPSTTAVPSATATPGPSAPVATVTATPTAVPSASATAAATATTQATATVAPSPTRTPTAVPSTATAVPPTSTSVPGPTPRPSGTPTS